MTDDLALPPPVATLRSPAPGPRRIATLTDRLTTTLAELKPGLVVVVGDVDTTVAGALAARRLRAPLAHVEAGLRARDRSMPEERNRVLVDALSDRLHLSEPQAEPNCRREGIALRRIRKPGNVMADALHAVRPALAAMRVQAERRFGLGGYVVATLHRQANVDDPRRLAAYVRALETVSRRIPVVFPVHPRTAKQLPRAGASASGLLRTAPAPYLTFLATVANAAAVVTDSGGLQVEAALLGVPCVTARDRTEHRLTLSHGGNRLAGNDPRKLAATVRRALDQPLRLRRRPRAWDGHAAERIVRDWLGGIAHGAHEPRRSAVWDEVRGLL